ncbi:galanin receptor type 1-like [Branchiostoma lanceolatum]|uniref:galanin receptor type 1-like n=1 Tax=Branchiostoma lanceolatum TaxID=7740 RepID=UPI00345655B3
MAETENPLATEAVVIPAVLGVIGVVGVVGNGLVILVIARSKDMRTVTNIYVVNMAVTDLAYLVFSVPPAAIVFAASEWPLGEALCKGMHYLGRVTLQASCLTLTAMSIDRFCAIVLPFRTISFRRTRVAIIISTCIWISSLLISIPVALRFKTFQVPITNQTLCREIWETLTAQKSYFVYIFCITYLVPVFISAVCGSLIVRQLIRSSKLPRSNLDRHERKMRRVTAMVLGVTVLFALLWLPTHAINLWRVMNPFVPGMIQIYRVKMVFTCLAFANSALNPFVYTFFGENFKVGLRRLFPWCCRRTMGASPQSSTRKSSMSHRKLSAQLSNKSVHCHRSGPVDKDGRQDFVVEICEESHHTPRPMTDPHDQTNVLTDLCSCHQILNICKKDKPLSSIV